MPFVRAGQLARPTPAARLDDAIGLVAENLRESHYGAIPVLDRVFCDDPSAPPSADEIQTRVLGIIDERDLSRATLPLLERDEWTRLNGEGEAAFIVDAAGRQSFAGADQGALDGEISGLTARQIMRSDIGIVPSQFSLHNALLTLDRYDAAALPVVDDAGRYRGMISRADVVAALGEQVRPPVVGGMATPLGVWLTTGSLSAGAPNLGLFLSGATLGGCFIASDAVMQFALAALNPLWGQMFASGRLGATSDGGGSFNLVVTALQQIIFLLILRALPMSGIHAAEHQTVWAIERGIALTPPNVAKMPRAHPRCGTNLMALAGLILIIFGHLPSFEPTVVLLSLLFVFLFWRNFGTALQLYLTTKPATPRQLESGIRAGRELLQKYQSQPHLPQSFAMRLFNSGLILSIAGFMGIQLLYDWAKSWLVGSLG